MDIGVLAALAVSKDAILDIGELGEGNSFDDGGRQAGEQQQRKGDQKQDGQGRSGLE